MKFMLAEKEFIFAEDRPFRSCHASTLIVLPNGEALASWFGGTEEKASDVAIWFSRRTVDGRWSCPVCVADEEHIAHWNPVLFRDQDGTVYLYYKVGHKITQWHTRVMASRDNGHTWDAPRVLVEGDVGGRGPVKNKPICLSNGAILAPASVELETPWNGFQELWDAFADISYDRGSTWRKCGVPLKHIIVEQDQPYRGNGIIQPALWESQGGHVHMLIRSTYRFIYRSDSSDLGETWCEAYATDLPNNNSGIDLVRMDNGLVALALNPVRCNSTKGSRSPLVIRVSADNGLTWCDELVLEDEPGEFSYPAIVANDERLFVTYTWNRERIAYREISVQV